MPNLQISKENSGSCVLLLRVYFYGSRKKHRTRHEHWCFSFSSEQQKAVDDLALTVDVINQTVGDAISDMLLVEIILSRRGWSAACWNEMYTDLPNRQLKVKVRVLSSSLNSCLSSCLCSYHISIQYIDNLIILWTFERYIPGIGCFNVCQVKDRTVITTGDAERRVVSPDSLQSSIDACVANYTNARSFVR